MQKKEEFGELNQLAFSSSNEISLKFKVIYCRYLLMNNQIDGVRESLIHLSKTIEKENNRIFFIYSNILMIFFIKTEKYKNAIDAGIKLTKIKGHESLGNDYELGVFYYNLASAYEKTYSYHEAKYYLQKALFIFNKNYDLEQALSCLILLGICYNNIKEWDKSYQASELAKKIINKYMPKEFTKGYLGMIENNLGNCFEYQGNYNKAIVFYLNSLNYLEANQQIIPITVYGKLKM